MWCLVGAAVKTEKRPGWVFFLFHGGRNRLVKLWGGNFLCCHRRYPPTCCSRREPLRRINLSSTFFFVSDCFFIFIFMFFYFSLLRMCLEFISAPFTVSRRGMSALARQGMQLITHNSGGGIPPRLIPQLIPSHSENRCFLDASAPQRQSFFFLLHSR